jgi:flagellar biosynthetic protein FlhB
MMSDTSDRDSRTEAPTQKKLEDARKKGQIAKSQDLNAAISLAVVAVFLMVFLTSLYEQALKLFQNAFEFRLQPDLAGPAAGSLLKSYLAEGAYMTAPIALTMMAVGLAGGLFQSRLLVTTEPLKPDFKRLNPIKGFKNIFSQKALVGLLKNLLKLGLVGLVMWNTLTGQLRILLRSASMDTGKLFALFTSLLGKLLVNVAVLMLILGMADYLYQIYDFRKSMRMTKQETKEEYKSLEGDPQVKSFRRQKQKQLAQQRMMQQVPEATVVITNPTHYAVAIRYDEQKDKAPVVIAKGLDLIAENIKKIAGEHGIPMIENRPLAQQMYQQIEIGQEIPAVLYQAMAEILALIFKANKTGK